MHIFQPKSNARSVQPRRANLSSPSQFTDQPTHCGKQQLSRSPPENQPYKRPASPSQYLPLRLHSKRDSAINLETPFFCCGEQPVRFFAGCAAMEMKKIACAVLFAAASVSAVMAQEEAPVPSPTSGAAACLPVVGTLVGASLVSSIAYYLH